MKRIATITAATLALSFPAQAYDRNQLHAPGSALIANGVNLYLYKTKPELTYRQRWLRSFGACMLVGVGVEAYQGLSGNGQADINDIGRDAIGCALQFNFEWRF